MRWPPLTFRTPRAAILEAGGLLVAVVAFAAACQSTRAVSQMNAETRTRETIDLLEGGVAAIGQRAATRNIAAWERQLRAENAPALDDLADTLDDLEAELGTDAPDGPTVGRILARLAEQTRSVAQRDGAPTRLDRLADVLAQAGEQLQ